MEDEEYSTIKLSDMQERIFERSFEDYRPKLIKSLKLDAEKNFGVKISNKEMTALVDLFLFDFGKRCFLNGGHSMLKILIDCELINGDHIITPEENVH